MSTPESSCWQLRSTSLLCLAFPTCTRHRSQPPGTRGLQLPLTECRLGAEGMPTSLHSPTSSFPSPSHKAGWSITIYQAWRPNEENHSRIKAGCWNTAFYGPVSIVQARAQKNLNHSPKRALSRHAPAPTFAHLPSRTTQERVLLHACIAQPFTNFL